MLYNRGVVGKQLRRLLKASVSVMKYLPLILKNLRRNKRRTILTTTSIAISMFIFSALLSLPAFLELVLRYSAASSRLVLHSKVGLAYSLPASSVTGLAR